MIFAQTADDKFETMTQAPVRKLVCTLAVPTIISMMITSIYNMADTFFVSQIGTSASGAVGVAFALMAIIQAIGFTIGMGSGNYISRLLGQKNAEYAKKVAATGFFTALILGFALSIIGLLLLDPLVYALGATKTIAPYARDYIRFILIGMPYMTSALVLNNIFRLQGSAFYAMLGITSGGILNIALDPLFIFTLRMGTGGAALATIISQFVSFCILFFNSGRNGTIKIHFRQFTPKWEIYREILRGGMPSFYRQGFGSISMVVLNFSAAPYGDAAIAAMSIVARVFQFAMSALVGFGQGFQPVCGFNYGAKRYDRVLEAFWFCVKISTVTLIVIAAVGFLIPREIMSVFRKGDLQVVATGALAMRFQCIVFPLNGWVIINNMLMQNIGKTTQASILSMSRQGVFLVPALLILPRFFGLMGVQLSQPVSDIFTFAISIPLGISILKEIKLKCQLEKQPDTEEIAEESVPCRQN